MMRLEPSSMGTFEFHFLFYFALVSSYNFICSTVLIIELMEKEYKNIKRFYDYNMPSLQKDYITYYVVQCPLVKCCISVL